jgi:DNA-binding LacI/PurR family transcriptional regulator
MSITIKDVAKRVGVTPATVSMVINKKPRISDETRRKVFEAIAELDYFPHEGARSLVLKRTHTVGVAAPVFTTPTVLETLASMEQAASESGYNFVLYRTDSSQKIDDAVIARIARERKIDGLIAVDLGLSPKQLAIFAKNNVAVVGLESEIEGCDRVLVDHAQGAMGATQHLLDLGHRRIAIVSSIAGGAQGSLREEGYRKALSQAGLTVDPALCLQVIDGKREEGVKVAEQLLQIYPRPTAVFVAAGDLCAAGLLVALKHAQVEVPRQMSVMGFDDRTFAEWLEPALTTMRQPLAKLGAEAFHVLEQLMQGDRTRRARKRLYPPELVVRLSTAPAPQA